MERLLNARLFGRGLVDVDTQELVSRYNECLEAVGLTPTQLERFRIDGTGWSPEIAQEKQDVYYLSHGEANQLFIVITPDQREKPVYFSDYSFERLIIKQLFERYGAEIANITSEAGLWLEIELGMSLFRSPEDLLLIDKAEVRACCTGCLMEAAREQHDLVRRFTEANNAWFDPSLRAQIIESARKHGDLRQSRLAIPEISFGDMEAFFARAFGGVFVFREIPGHQALVILADGASAPAATDEGVVFARLSDPELFSLLEDEKLIELNPELYARHPEQLAQLWECLLGDVISREAPEVDYAGLTTIQKKGWIRKLSSSIPDVFFDLERLMARMRLPGFVHPEQWPQGLAKLLVHPRHDLPAAVREVVWQLLCRLSPQNAMRLYRHDKDHFFELYRDWPDNKRRWVTHLIENPDCIGDRL